MENGNESAFPEIVIMTGDAGRVFYPKGGLTKREHISIGAFNAMLANPALLEAVTSWDITIGDAKTKVALKAIEYADELLHQLSLSEGKKGESQE